MRARRVFWLSTTLAVGALLAGAFATPACRDIVHGVMNNEPFASGMPISYWIRELDSAESETRRNAINAIADMGRDGASAIPALTEIARHDDIAIRSLAIMKGLGSIGPAAVPALCEFVLDRKVRTTAVATIGQIGPEAKAAVPVLTKAIKDENTWTRIMVGTALGNIGAAAKDAVPFLIEAAKTDKQPRVRFEMALAVQKIDRHAAAKAGFHYE
jgi:HEAT repeat protein